MDEIAREFSVINVTIAREGSVRKGYLQNIDFPKRLLLMLFIFVLTPSLYEM